MSEKSILFIILLLWGIPSTYFRSQFRKIVYQTDDWKINIKPLFRKEMIGLFGNIYPENSAYVSSRNRYRIYLIVYLVLFLMYQLSAMDLQ